MSRAQAEVWAHQRGVPATGRWVSGLSGAALVAIGAARRTVGGAIAAVAGSALVHRGVAGRWPLARDRALEEGDAREAAATKVEESVLVQASPAQLYALWRDVGNLPRYLPHLVSVTPLEGKRSKWVAKALGVELCWDAEPLHDQPDHFLAWSSIEGGDVDHEGAVRFIEHPNGRGTEVRVSLRYAPPLGKFGAAIGRLLGDSPRTQLHCDLRRFQCLVETGEFPKIEGQPQGQ